MERTIQAQKSKNQTKVVAFFTKKKKKMDNQLFSEQNSDATKTVNIAVSAGSLRPHRSRFDY